MRSNPAFRTAEEFSSYIQKKATEDTEFRFRLLADPKGVIGEELDLPIPDGFNVVVHEDTPNTANFVLPPSAALTEKELAASVGGRSVFNNWCTPI